MNASKENARLAMEKLTTVSDSMSDLLFLEDFLKAVEKRLPSEEAIERDKARRKVRQEEYKEGARMRRSVSSSRDKI